MRHLFYMKYRFIFAMNLKLKIMITFSKESVLSAFKEGLMLGNSTQTDVLKMDSCKPLVEELMKAFEVEVDKIVAKQIG